MKKSLFIPIFLFLLLLTGIAVSYERTDDSYQKGKYPYFNQYFPLTPTYVPGISRTPDTFVTRYISPISSPNPVSKCVIDGCSGQYCIDELKGANMNTTCEWKEYYSCFRSAECKRQPNGECGWTQTSELLSCIESKRNN
jgi:hypothetical protein